MKEDRVKALLHKWCTSLLDTQVHSDDKRLNGALLCPACGKIHGRCFEAMYPFFEMARETGDEKWIKAAEDVFAWSEHTVSLSDGGYINDIDSEWKGITVFALIAFLDTLEGYSDLMSDEFRTALYDRAKKAADWIYNENSLLKKNTNYPVSASYALYRAGLYFEDEKLIEKSKGYEKIIYSVFTENNFVFGEGFQREMRSDKNLLAVDIGYNVEETLPAITFLGLLKNDSKLIDLAVKGYDAHLDFMLSDGAWDNSFGTRNFKWTYWGSRTSDGCAEALLLLKEHNKAFYTAAIKNLELMEKCTFSGLLAGGPDYEKAGQPMCIHHSFTHAKVLAGIIKRGLLAKEEETISVLPRYERKGLRYYKDLDTFVFSSEHYSATVTGYDWPYMAAGHTSGGTLSMLEFICYGPVLTASIGRYFLKEKNNMQVPYGKLSHECPDFRLSLVEDGTEFSSRYCDEVKLERLSDSTIKAIGYLQSEDGKEPSCRSQYSIEYQFAENGLRISIHTDRECLLILPFISCSESVKVMDDGSFISEKNNKRVDLRRLDSGKIQVPENPSYFLVPGFMFEHLELPSTNKSIDFEITL